jgi:hypothetical protein
MSRVDTLTPIATEAFEVDEWTDEAIARLLALPAAGMIISSTSDSALSEGSSLLKRNKGQSPCR